MAPSPTDGGFRLSSATHAPEVDAARLAPEYRDDIAAPEVIPEAGVQVFYHDSPPEATAAESPEDTDFPPASPAPIQKVRRKLYTVLVIIIMLILIFATIGINLGLNLRRQGKGNTKDTATPSSTSTPPRSSDPSTQTSSTPAHASAISHTLQRSIMSNTSITALTLDNTNRHVYFQEPTGAFRRTVYSSRANIWQATADPLLVPDAKNNTPLASIYPLANAEVVNLSYISSDNHLRCTSWNAPHDCPLLDKSLESITVAEDCRQISALELRSKGLLLTYQEPSGAVVIMLGHIDEDSQWRWRNETDKFNIHGPGVCSASRQSQSTGFEILCFMKGDSLYKDIIRVIYFSPNSTTPGNLTIDGIAASVLLGENPARLELNTRTSPDIGLLSDQQIIWLNQSRLEYFELNGFRGPSPKTRFPYPHFASTWAMNSTDSYVYHQLSDTVIAEEHWDGGKSGFWISRNITID